MDLQLIESGDIQFPVSVYVFTGALIQFVNFTSEVNHDFLEVRNGPQHSSSLIGQFSGTQLPPDLLSTTHEIVIHFYTDHSQNQQGFRLTYKGETFPIFFFTEYELACLHVQMFVLFFVCFHFGCFSMENLVVFI